LRRDHGDLTDLRAALRRDLVHEQAPPALRARIGHDLDQERSAGIGSPDPRPRRPWQLRPFWLGALGGIGSAAVAATVAFFLVSARLNDPLLDERVTAHVHSLLPDHLIAVVSTDRHGETWFAGAHRRRWWPILPRRAIAWSVRASWSSGRAWLWPCSS
jgi:hypothetical protein